MDAERSLGGVTAGLYLHAVNGNYLSMLPSSARRCNISLSGHWKGARHQQGILDILYKCRDRHMEFISIVWALQVSIVYHG